MVSLILALMGATLVEGRCEGTAIRQVAPAMARPGEGIEYRIEVSQHGGCEVRELEVTDYLPQESDWISATPEPRQFPDSTSGEEDESPMPVARLRWEVKSLVEGGTLNFRVVVRVPDRKSGWMRNTVCIAGIGVPRKCDVIETFVRRD